ncbi:DinB family protein [Runella sp.]|uniref:DinB family protein n=1 Tax=Runella sp. TaxID=1960881 RepID=UPI003D131DC2
MTTNQLIVKMVFDRWNTLLKNGDTILNAITDEQLQKEIAPNKNRGIYLLGHLIAVHDDMLPLLNLGDKEHPELFEIFVKSPDKSVEVIPSPQELRALWKNQLENLTQKLASLSVDEWFEKHTSVSAEDFIKEPHRNKLNIIITRTTHLAYHVGQLILLK